MAGQLVGCDLFCAIGLADRPIAKSCALELTDRHPSSQIRQGKVALSIAAVGDA
ncbi:MAG: hypothetical protein HC860_25360 [Alkalinema sp. RU_4_3]|nr:hypothetical protein [Alkalinema sp. RU_4_3]